MALQNTLRNGLQRLRLLRGNSTSFNQKWFMGLVNLAAVVIFWVMSSFLVNDLFESDIYRKPFLITYINTACFSFYLIPYLYYEKISIPELYRQILAEYKLVRFKSLDFEATNYGSGSEDTDSALINDDTVVNQENTGIFNQSKLDIGVFETVKLSVKFCILWFSANLVTNASLSYTSVASQTILSSTSSFFTLVVGYFYSVERINRSKIYGIILCFSGVLIVTEVDSLSSDSSKPVSNSNLSILFGNALALAGALVYGIYTILLKLSTMVKNSSLERNLNTHLFFAVVGLSCLLFFWPIIILLHFTGTEIFALPKTKHILVLLLINILITFISDFCWCKAVILTSPLTVTVGLSLTIPLAMVGDWVIKGFKVNWIYVTGAAIVTIGFLIINNDEKEDHVNNRPE